MQTSRRAVPQNPPGTYGLVRHQALVALSRDHHAVLVHALALKRASQAKASTDAALAAAGNYLRFHDAEMVGHMADEERVLLPLAGAADPEGAERILAEHHQIEALTQALRDVAGTPARPTLLALGELLDDHVRFEERAFFMRVQQGLDEDALERLGLALDSHRSARGFAPTCPLPPRT